MLCKILALLCLIVGEILTIYAELAGARVYAQLSMAITLEVLQLALLVVFGSLMLFLGYSVGIIAFKSIWVVSAISVTTILLVEPAIAYFLFRELPSRGALIGLILGALGLVATLRW